MNQTSPQRSQNRWSTQGALLLLAACAACSSDAAQPDSNTPDAATATSDSSTSTQAQVEEKVEEPNYEAAFPQDSVARIDIKISEANWQAMMDDMTALAGPFGEGMGRGPGGRGGGPPVGSSRVDLQACKLEYSIVSPK